MDLFAEKAEVVATRLGRDENENHVIILTLRFSDLLTDDIFIPVNNANRLRGDIDNILSKIKYRPPVVDPPLLKHVQKYKRK